ncbi:MAG: dTDP-4-dehydrorhamnose reductase (RfbD-2) [uncultured bacterium]|nr:MAG: dTDP-4-dehydrorhamnose reductase (RfbD-2) [uncultured bacterium]
MIKILITGSNGFIGRHLYRNFQTNYELLGLDLKNDIVTNTKILDCSDLGLLTKELNNFKPDVIIHTAAIKQLELCEEHRAFSWKVNVNSTETIAKYSKESGAKVIYISSDVVFDGETGDYEENQPPSPINWYGATKVASENAVRLLPNSAICRTALVIGNIDDDYSQILNNELKNDILQNQTLFVQYTARRLKMGFPVYISSAYMSNPTSVLLLTSMISKITQNNLSGIFHTVGSTAISRLDFARLVARIYGLNSSLIITDDSKISTIRPKDITLSFKSTYDRLDLSEKDGSLELAVSKILI